MPQKLGLSQNEKDNVCRVALIFHIRAINKSKVVKTIVILWYNKNMILEVKERYLKALKESEGKKGITLKELKKKYNLRTIG